MKALILTVSAVLMTAGSAFANIRDIQNVQWTLTYANGREVTSAIAYFEVEGSGRFTGSTGCNSMFGTVDVRGQRIDFSNVGTTRKMCKLMPGSVSETAFLNALEKAARFARNGNTLHLYDNRGRTILRFKRQTKQPPISEPDAGGTLESRRWALESIGDRKTFAPIKGVFINFDAAKGSAGGNSGCNVFGGEYSAKGSRISISDVVSTMRACVEDGRMTVEREFFDGLRAANRFEIRDGRLFLYKGQNLRLTLRGEPNN